VIKRFRGVLLLKLASIALAMLAACFCSSAVDASGAVRSPIRHVIVIVGENHSFDNLFGAYRPDAGSGQSVMNLLSEGIINPDGTAGPHFSKAEQWQAIDKDKYSIAPARAAPYARLPQPNTTFAFGQPPGLPDARFPVDLPNGPFQISKYTAYQLSYTGDPSHRFFQMWQQYDEGRNDLFVWDAVTVGFGNDGKPPPSPFTEQSTHQGGVAMGFYDMSQGDAPVFKFVADHYAMSDNFHQAVMGGTGASFIFLGTADMAFYSDGNGNPLTPPKELIEDPNPWPGSNNWYKQDGYHSGSYVNLRGPVAGGCRGNRRVPGIAASIFKLRARAFLPGQQLRASVQPGWHSRRYDIASVHAAAPNSPEYWGETEQGGNFLEILYRRSASRRSK
jgi:Phosphoesterase family